MQRLGGDKEEPYFEEVDEKSLSRGTSSKVSLIYLNMDNGRCPNFAIMGHNK